MAKLSRKKRKELTATTLTVVKKEVKTKNKETQFIVVPPQESSEHTTETGKLVSMTEISQTPLVPVPDGEWVDLYKGGPRVFCEFWGK